MGTEARLKFLVKHFSPDFQVADQKISSQTRPPLWARSLARLMEQPFWTSLTLIFLDILAASVGLIAALVLSVTYLGAEAVTEEYIRALVLYNIFLILVFYLISGYNHIRTRRHEDELRIIVTASNYAMLLLLIGNFIFNKNIVFSRYIIIFWFIFALFSLIILRFSLHGFLKRLWEYGLARENALIIGNSVKDIRWLLEYLHIQRYKGINILGYLSGKGSLISNLPFMGKFDNLKDIVSNKKINIVFFAMSKYSEDEHSKFLTRLEECCRLNLSSIIITEIFNNYNFSLNLDGYTDIVAIDRKNPAYSRLMFRVIKRSMDIFGALLCLLATWPIWLIVALAIKVEDGGPILFRRRVIGKDGQIFHALKIRTMLTNAHEILQKNPDLLREFQKNYKLKNDPRLTRVGKWLRKSSLDEMPQFINVLKGDMSLVGPRIVTEKELERYGEFKFERLKVRPGLTGFWQVSGRTTTDYEERIQMDRFYIYKCNIWMDLIILFKTPYKVLKGDGAV